MALYLSTSCINKDIFEAIKLYTARGITNIELGARAPYHPQYTRILKKYNAHFLVHNYFPPPKKSFILNLASANKTIRKKSIAYLKHSIDFCAKIKIPLLTLHAGFRADPKPNFSFDKAEPIDYDKAFSIFIQSIEEIARYAKQRRITIGIENNVVEKKNLRARENKFLLLSQPDEFKHFFSKINASNVGILLDTGHLQVTAHWLKFDKNDFITSLMNHIVAAHIHDNDGREDQHLPVAPETWTYKLIKKWLVPKNIPIVIESKFKNISSLFKNYTLLSRVCYE